MEFHEKLQQLRKEKGLTQEQLAAQLFVSRTAVSKWESGRGYPGIDSLKAIGKFYGVSVDELLSGEELLTAAQEDSQERENRFRDVVFGLLDCGSAMFFFLPLFGQELEGVIREVSLPGLTVIQPWLKASYFAVVMGAIIIGILTLALQNCGWPLWVRNKSRLSLVCNGAAVLLFILSRQPYAAALAFVFFIIKALLPGNKG